MDPDEAENRSGHAREEQLMHPLRTAHDEVDAPEEPHHRLGLD